VYLLGGLGDDLLALGVGPLADGAAATGLGPLLYAEPADDVVAAIHLAPELELLHVDEADAALVVHVVHLVFRVAHELLPPDVRCSGAAGGLIV
jgi:hypothetical protein